MVPDADWLPSYRKDEIPFISIEDVEVLDQQWKEVGQPDYWREHEKHAYWMPVHAELNWIPTNGPRVSSFCGWHYSVAVIQPGGQLSPCCITAKESDRFGTVVAGEVLLADVWNNEYYRKSRAVFTGETIAGLDDTDTVCSRCYYPDALRHSQSNNDSKIIAQFLSVFGSSHPVHAQAFKLLLEGESESVREQFVVFVEAQLKDLLEGIRTEEANVAKEKVSAPLLDALALEDLTFDEAATIAQCYMSELSRIGMNGQIVHDISLLSYSKSRITAALLILLEAASDPEAALNYRNGIMVLAFFQPGIGPKSVGIDELGPGQETWQEIVAREMRNLILP